jgi:hypothetical protein
LKQNLLSRKTNFDVLLASDGNMALKKIKMLEGKIDLLATD